MNHTNRRGFVEGGYLLQKIVAGLGFGILIFLLISCTDKLSSVYEVEMYNQDGDMVGTATFTEHSEGVEVKVEVEGLSPGFHGIHFHEFPHCEGPDFKTAGNHLNPENKQHGRMHPEGFHLGDLPNVEADLKGKVNAEVILEGATLLDGKNSLLEDGGGALIITENPDDGLTQPGGNSGKRLICGELKKGVKKDGEKPTDPTEINEENESSNQLVK